MRRTLVREGIDLDQAWQRIPEARGLSVADTEAQRAWVTDRRLRDTERG